MSDNSWRLGQICDVDGEVNLEKAIVIAEVYSRALCPDDGGLVASYILAHDLDADVAERAMTFFSNQVSLLVDGARLVEDVGAEFPALVTIRYTPETPDYLATAHEWDLLRLLPDDNVISRDGWDAFCVFDALVHDRPVVSAGPLPEFNERELRRKVLVARSSIEEDRTPWLVAERNAILEVTKDRPEGCETFLELADDIEAVLNSKIEVSDRYSVVIPTKVERRHVTGAVSDWIPQAGREIVVAHGLDPVQAARALKVVADDPQAFVEKTKLRNNADEREILTAPVMVPDVALNWISTDFAGRRDPAGYQRLQARLNGQAAEMPLRVAVNER